MKYCFITIIHFLKLETDNCSIPLASGVISNQKSLLRDILSYNNKLSLHTLGVHSIDEFENQTFYKVSGDFPKDISKLIIYTYGTSLTLAFLRQIQSLTNDFWKIRDNSIYIRDGFLFVYEHKIEDGVTFKASLSTINTKASTKIEDVVFSYDEIVNLSKEMQLISIEKVCSGTNYKFATQFQYFKNAKLGRKDTAWLYIFHARAIPALSIKILMYITAMESLVSTSVSELSHQVAERVAILIGIDLNERLQIYSVIKKGYTVRSKAAHGEQLKGAEQDVVDSLVLLDDYLRRMMKLDSPYDLNVDKLNEFFTQKLMERGNNS